MASCPQNQFPQAIGAMQRMQETRCNKAMTAVPPTMWMVCRMEPTILYVVELSSPVDISSMKRARPGVTIISAATPISGSGALCLEYQSGKSAVYQDVQEKSCYQLQPENLISLLFRITGLTVLTVAQNFAALQEAL
uniref:Uncharacterized protein n=1 Tax=Oryza nivara TaxID=4536 RepID=A0A0E0IHU9_ORYNI